MLFAGDQLLFSVTEQLLILQHEPHCYPRILVCKADAAGNAAGNAAVPEGGLEGGVGKGGRGRVQAAGRATLLRVGC